MWTYFVVGILTGLCVLTVGDDVFLDEHCKNKPDGHYDVACRAYITCTSGKAHQMFCLNGQVYNLNTGVCDDAIHVPPPCGIRMNCTARGTGRYPDLIRQCRFYYTCVGDQFLGHNGCPGTLVFNETLGICDWKNDVFPPCGTRQL